MFDVRHVTYTYDGMGRLTSEDNTTYTYDLRGNRATKSSKIYSYTIDNRILNSTINGTTYDSYMYSGSDMWLDGEYYPNGNSYEYILTFDSFKRLKRAQRLIYADTGNLYGDINYTYNGDNQRVSKEIEDDNFYEEYIWDGDDIVMTKSGTNITVYKRGLRLFASDGDNGKKYYNYNGHGDVVELIDATGNIIKAYDYDAFGNEHTFYDESDTNPFRYCGEFYDTETRYIYLRARYYSPRMGRFISEDTHWNPSNMIYGDKEYKAGEIKIPDINVIKQSNNLYVYCMNNPMNYVDPLGMLAYPGQIHNLVVNKVAAKHALNKEQTINYNFGWGRADLISNDGAVWDVKRDKPNQIASGVTQVQKYVANTWKKYPNTKLSVGGEIAPGEFIQTINIDTYYISYRYAGNGVIAYDYYKVTDWDTVKAYASAAGMTVLSTLAFLLSQGAVQLQPAW